MRFADRQVPGVAVPAAATPDTVRARCGTLWINLRSPAQTGYLPPIRAPLIKITVHVIQSPRIWQSRANRFTSTIIISTPNHVLVHQIAKATFIATLQGIPKRKTSIRSPPDTHTPIPLPSVTETYLGPGHSRFDIKVWQSSQLT